MTAIPGFPNLFTVLGPNSPTGSIPDRNRRTSAERSRDRRRRIGRKINGMCRNIRTLHNFEPPATTDEVHAAALQYVRKVAGTTKPSQANVAAFDEAVEAVAAATQHLLDHLVTSAAPKDREVEAAKAKARSAARYA
ncbi:hypothetical protein GCM10023217_15440 [Gordonia alkaliphila]|uniref:DUF2277 domain-containing protein n=2 Tax=Gordonia alkaliphila TaxID=1053547 RepID=A0ABP8Z517_9ACTN